MIFVVVVFVLGAALVLYTILGGADFGAGVVAMFSSKQARELIFDAIAPVWEANHVWLILVIVVLFNGFPRVYSTVSMFLHLPLFLALVGIIFRGSMYAFKHYDVDRDHRFYAWVFYLSSLLTPLFWG